MKNKDELFDEYKILCGETLKMIELQEVMCVKLIEFSKYKIYDKVEIYIEKLNAEKQKVREYLTLKIYDIRVDIDGYSYKFYLPKEYTNGKNYATYISENQVLRVIKNG